MYWICKTKTFKLAEGHLKSLQRFPELIWAALSRICASVREAKLKTRSLTGCRLLLTLPGQAAAHLGRPEGPPCQARERARAAPPAPFPQAITRQPCRYGGRYSYQLPPPLPHPQTQTLLFPPARRAVSGHRTDVPRLCRRERGVLAASPPQPLRKYRGGRLAWFFSPFLQSESGGTYQRPFCV